MIAYEDDADLEVDYSGDEPVVQNHDEIVDSGGTFGEVRALKRRSAEEYDLDIIERGDPLWDDRLADLDSGESWRVDELRE